MHAFVRMTRSSKRSSREGSTSLKNESEKPFEKAKCIPKRDLPMCYPGPCRVKLPPNKIDVNARCLRRKDVFYNKWSDQEIQTFEGLYKSLSRLRDRRHIFQTIATKLPSKTIADCVHYYYLYKNIRTFKVRSKLKQKRKQRQKCT